MKGWRSDSKQQRAAVHPRCWLTDLATEFGRDRVAADQNLGDGLIHSHGIRQRAAAVRIQIVPTKVCHGRQIKLYQFKSTEHLTRH